MKYKVGDRVVIREDAGIYNTENWNHEMAKWRGKIMTVKSFRSYMNDYNMYEDEGESIFNSGKGWFWDEHRIDHEATAKLHLEEQKKFTIDDLKNGDVVRVRNGQLYIFISDGEDKLFYNQVGRGHLANMTRTLESEATIDYDIVEVLRPKSLFAIKLICEDQLPSQRFDSIWTRQEPKKMTKSEIESKLGYEIEIV